MAGETIQAKVTVDASRFGPAVEMSRYGLGQGGISDKPMFSAHVDSLKHLGVKLIRLFVQEYYDLYPGHGQYHWATLDRAIEDILSAGAKPLLALCMKPRVLYPTGDPNVVDPTDYAEWEEFVCRLVRHCNEEKRYGVEFWEVFNEPDQGEFGGCSSNWTPASYCRFYERTVRGILRGDPKAKVGGPAAVSQSYVKALLDHCSRNSVPIHFVSWHVYNDDPLAHRQRVEEVKDLLRQHPSLKCETAVTEWNMGLWWTRREPEFQPCFIVDATCRMLDAGLDYACYYHIRDLPLDEEQFSRLLSPKQAARISYWCNQLPWYLALFDFQGIPRPAYFAFKLLSRMNGQRLPVKTDRPEIKALAVWNEKYEALHVLLWSFAMTPPAACRIALEIENLPQAKWRLWRSALDASCASPEENNRIRLDRTDPFENVPSVRDEHDLPPYGITFTALKKMW